MLTLFFQESAWQQSLVMKLLQFMLETTGSIAQVGDQITMYTARHLNSHFLT